MSIKIKDLKPGARIWFEGHGDDEIYTVYGKPYIGVDNIWYIDVTDDGDYCWVFSEPDEQFLHLEDKQ